MTPSTSSGGGAVGDAAFLGGLLGGAGQQAAERFAREVVALGVRDRSRRHGVVEDSGQDAVGGHDRDDLAHHPGGTRHDQRHDFLVLGVEEIVGGGDPDAEQMDQFAVKHPARGRDIHQVIDGLEQGREQVLAPAEAGLGERSRAHGVFCRCSRGSGEVGSQAGMHFTDAFLLLPQGGAGDAAGFKQGFPGGIHVASTLTGMGGPATGKTLRMIQAGASESIRFRRQGRYH